MWDWLEREAIYLWYYLDIQIRQIAPYWAFAFSILPVSMKAKDGIPIRIRY